MKTPLRTICLAFAALLVTRGAAARADDKPDPNGFVPTALSAGLAEVQKAKLADKHSNSDAVKRYAQRLVKDHTDANNRLMQFAKDMKLAVAETLSKEDRQRMSDLSKLNGDDFDRAFLRTMVADHEKAVKLFEDEAKNNTSKNKDVQAFAEKTLPTLRDHLKEARDLLGKLKIKENK